MTLCYAIIALLTLLLLFQLLLVDAAARSSHAREVQCSSALRFGPQTAAELCFDVLTLPLEDRYDCMDDRVDVHLSCQEARSDRLLYFMYIFVLKSVKSLVPS